ncbi:MAG: ATP-binding protein [Hyphomicrobium sp.]
MHLHAPSAAHRDPADTSIGRIVSVTGSKAIILLDSQGDGRVRSINERPEMGTLLGIDTANTVVLAIVSALSVPVPAQREGDSEIWIAELGLVGELWRGVEGRKATFNRGVTVYPALGDRCRVASKAELEIAFCGDSVAAVRVGCIRQDSSIPAMVRVDDLLGKHFAILGTTGTGKSCTTALILRSILEKNPAAHIVLLDPHNEYSTAFSEWAEVINPRNMSLPFWMLTFEEIVEVLVGDPERKAEIEILQDLIPIAKSRYSAGRGGDAGKLRRGVIDTGRYTCDTPVPYRISDLTSLIDERMGKLENKRDLAPYRQLKNHIENITQDARYGFMFGSLTVYDGMTQVLGRIFRVPVNSKPITILELTGIPTEIVNVVVSVLCRITFDFALWGEGHIPVTLVCEEAHRYVPANPTLGFEPCKRAIAKIAKEGRKYGASLCIVTQRPAEIDATILSQCNTVFALRMSNDKDQAIVQSAVSDTGSGLLEFLPSLGQREAIAFGDGMSLPVRIKFDELPKHALPRSSTARFSEKWQKSTNDETFLEQIVDRWRASGLGSGADSNNGTAMMAEAMGIQGGPSQEGPDSEAGLPETGVHRTAPIPAPGFGSGAGQAARAGMVRRDAPQPPPAHPERRQPTFGAPPPQATDRRTAAPPPPPASATPNASASLRSLRDRLTRGAD